MNPPKSHWSLVYYQHPDNDSNDCHIREGADNDLESAGWQIVGRHMYTEPLMMHDCLVGTRYVFALEDKSGIGHVDVIHEWRKQITLHPEPAVRADRDHEDADRDADARRAQAADEAHDAYMTRDRYYRR